MLPRYIKEDILDYIGYFSGIGGCTISEVFEYINAHWPIIVKQSQIRHFLDYLSRQNNSQIKKKVINSLNKRVLYYCD